MAANRKNFVTRNDAEQVDSTANFLPGTRSYSPTNFTLRPRPPTASLSMGNKIIFEQSKHFVVKGLTNKAICSFEVGT